MTMEQMSVSLDLMHMRMNDILNTGNPELNEIISYLLSEPGKMLRPRLVFLASSLYPSDPKVVQDAAIALELIHMASLVHDDVIDGSLLRRGRDSVNGRWGSKASVLVGDYLFATAFNLLNQHHIPDILESVTSTIQTMCSGEIQQLSTAFDTDMSLTDYLDRIYRKTVCLFECCCRVGALASTMPAQQRKNLQMYGVSMGLAYQIIDDVLDFLSTPQSLGKPSGSDLLEGNITLPVIYGLQDNSCREELIVILEKPAFLSGQLQRVTELLHQCGAFEKSIQLAKSYLVDARASLRSLPYPGREPLSRLSQALFQDYFNKMASLSWQG
jgi:heptaprenyl diphosphate synthase